MSIPALGTGQQGLAVAASGGNDAPISP